MVFLGIAGGFGHDASVAVVRDGRLVLVVEEERLARSKGARGMIPESALVRAMETLALAPEDVRHVGFAWDPNRDPSNDRMATTTAAILMSPTFKALSGAPWTFLPHHDCHSAAALALAPPPADGVTTAVLVMDGRGETASTSVYIADRATDGAGRLVASSPLAASLGTFFAAATAYCGFGPDGAGKTMGLAAFGTADSRFDRVLDVDGLTVAAYGADARHGIDATTAHRAVYRDWIRRYERTFGPPGNRTQDRIVAGHKVHGASADAAATAQWLLERVVGQLLRNLNEETSPGRILLTGGVALNCAMNGSLRNQHPHLVLNPVPSDAGVSIGAAVLASQAAGEPVEGNPSPYLGQSWNDGQLKATAAAHDLSFWRPPDLEVEVAQRLAAGQTVGWFQGRAEVGPRALGHRSILGRVGDPTTRTILNHLKGREPWRPLGPSISAEEAVAAFGTNHYPFMIEAARPTPAAVPRLAAAVHVDGTSRPHVPTADTSARYALLLREVGRLTGTQAVVNTSFNIGPEPIVNSPADAVATFLRSSLDLLCLGPLLAIRTSRAR